MTPGADLDGVLMLTSLCDAVGVMGRSMWEVEELTGVILGKEKNNASGWAGMRAGAVHVDDWPLGEEAELKKGESGDEMVSFWITVLERIS